MIATLGVALVAGAGAAIWHTAIHPANVSTAGAYGLLVATLVLALAMIVAGLLRRRSGFLAFATVVALLSATAAAAAPPLAARIADLEISVANSLQAQDPIVQERGRLYIELSPLGTEAPPPLVIEKGEGSTSIIVWPGVELDLVADVEDLENAYWQLWDETDESNLIAAAGQLSPGPGGLIDVQLAVPGVPVLTRQRVELRQTGGSIDIQLHTIDLRDVNLGDPLPTATASPAPEGASPDPTSR